MVDRLIEVKSSVQELAGVGNKNLFLTNAQWEQAEELRDILQRAFEVTKKLQFDDITPGYFYKKWSGLGLCYENNDSLLATEIAKSMKKREADLLNNGLLLAAVCLDVTGECREAVLGTQNFQAGSKEPAQGGHPQCPSPAEG
jgi:hypothetical protein